MCGRNSRTVLRSPDVDWRAFRKFNAKKYFVDPILIHVDKKADVAFLINPAQMEICARRSYFLTS